MKNILCTVAIAIIIVILLQKLAIGLTKNKYSDVKPSVERPLHDVKHQERYKSKRFPLGVYAVRPLNRVSNQTQKLVELVTVKDNTRPVGSFKWLVHKYPGDIDIMERITECCSTEDAQIKIAQNIQNVIRDIQNTPTTIVGDVKVGIDPRFKLDIGSLKVETNTVIGFDQQKLITRLTNLYEKKLLTNQEYSEMVRNARLAGTGDVSAWANLKEQLRQLYTLRWNVCQIIKGKRPLRGGKIITLEDAINDPTIVKIDMLAQVNGNYTEITNFFLLAWKDVKGYPHVYDPSAYLFDKRLGDDIKKYSSRTYYDPMKLLKRLWNWSTLKNIKNTAEILAPIFGSDVSKLKQVASEIETLVLMLENREKYRREQHKIVDVNAIMKQIDRFHRRIVDIDQFEFDAEPMHTLINEILFTDSAMQAVKLLTELKSKIDAVVFEQADRFYNEHKNVLFPKIKQAIESLDTSIESP